jgi:hypothetical protein
MEEGWQMFNNVTEEIARKITLILNEEKAKHMFYYDVGINEFSGFYFSWHSNVDVVIVEKIIAERLPELNKSNINEIFDISWMQR